MYKYYPQMVALRYCPSHTTSPCTLAQSSFGIPTFQHHTSSSFSRFNLKHITHYLRKSPENLCALRLSKQPSLARPNITMTYSYHRHQTLCRLGVEQLPSLCDPEMPAAMRNKCEYDGRPAPVSGDLPVRSVPVSRSRCCKSMLHPPY
jgi:hypothetical protein